MVSNITERISGLFHWLAGPQRGETTVDRLAFLFVFVGAKVVALVGMLWLARVAAPEVFGGVELALSAALIVAGVGLLGIPGGVTRLSLAMDEPRIADHLSFTALCIAGPATISAFTTLALGGSPVAVLMLASCAVVAFQVSASTYARIRARPMLNSVVDPLPVLSMLTIALGLWATDRLTMAAMAVTMTLLACALTMGLAIGFALLRRPQFLVSYRRALAISLPLLAFSGVAMMVGAGLRPLLGIRFSLEDLALYSLCFRLCAPSMLMHQMLMTAFFARMYQATDKAFDRVVTGLAGACILTVIVLSLSMPILVPMVFPAYEPALASLAAIFPLVGLQVVYWILIALMEMKIGRHAVAAGAAVTGYVIFALFAAAFLALPIDTLVQATALFDLALAAFAVAQFILLRRRGVDLPLIAAMVPVAGLTCGLLVWAA